MSDTVSDMLTRLRNAACLHKQYVEFPAAKHCVSIIGALKRSGMIWDYDVTERSQRRFVRVVLKYSQTGEPVMSRIDRVSKPGNRVFAAANAIPSIRQGLGICLLSTNSGLLNDSEARARGIGGEIICTVY
jgi:small subunit ribosomal protein S8